MKLIVLPCFFLILVCGSGLSSYMAVESTSTSQSEDFSPSKPSIHGAKGLIGFHGDGRRRQEYRRKDVVISHSIKAHSGGAIGGTRGPKGASGGANIVRRPKPDKSAASSMISKPSFFLSATAFFLVRFAVNLLVR